MYVERKVILSYLYTEQNTINQLLHVVLIYDKNSPMHAKSLYLISQVPLLKTL